jgi:hypothetical protein
VGERVITIEAMSREGLEPGDTTKIVTAIDIYKPEDFAYTSPFAETLPGQAGLFNTLDGTNYPANPQLQPLIGGGIPMGGQGFVFAPQIKVVGGNDFSTGQDMAQGQEVVEPSQMIDITNPLEMEGGTGKNKALSESGKVDFARLQIKKLE